MLIVQDIGEATWTKVSGSCRVLSTISKMRWKISYSYYFLEDD
jgi:hypothetical protein